MPFFGNFARQRCEEEIASDLFISGATSVRDDRFSLKPTRNQLDNDPLLTITDQDLFNSGGTI